MGKMGEFQRDQRWVQVPREGPAPGSLLGRVLEGGGGRHGGGSSGQTTRTHFTVSEFLHRSLYMSESDKTIFEYFCPALFESNGSSQKHLEKDQQSWRYHSPDIKYKVSVLKIVWYWHENIYISGTE